MQELQEPPQQGFTVGEGAGLNSEYEKETWEFIAEGGFWLTWPLRTLAGGRLGVRHHQDSAGDGPEPMLGVTNLTGLLLKLCDAEMDREVQKSGSSLEDGSESPDWGVVEEGHFTTLAL